MSRLREDQKVGMSRLREDQKVGMSRLREDQKVGMSPRGIHPLSPRGAMNSP
jgi:cold shock CspA family protein